VSANGVAVAGPRRAQRPAPARRERLAVALLLRRLVDGVAVVLAVVGGALAEPLLGTPIDAPRIGASLVIALAWFAGLRIAAPHERRGVAAGHADLRAVLTGTIGVFGLVAAASVLFPVVSVRTDLFVTLPLGVLLLLVGRLVVRARTVARRASGRHLPRALIVGSGPAVDFVIQQLGRTPAPSYLVAGIVRTGETPSIAERPESEIVAFHDAGQVAVAAAAISADAVIVAGQPDDAAPFLRSLAWDLESLGTELVVASAIDGVDGRRLHVATSAGLPLLHVEAPRFTGAQYAVKRAMDIAVAGGALLVLAPLLLVVAVVVRIDSKGPALFRQERVGVRGSRFTMLKFRSMVVTAEADLAALLAQNEGNGVLFKLKRDPRVTRVGAALRKYSLDELPQLWNIFIGDMSLVGPRPPLAREVAEYEAHVHRRLYLKPGLTGAWQVSGRSDLSWDESVRLDLSYVDNWSVVDDLRILFRTAKVVIHPTGAY
jgi:exopolysaccharide biosynthesis polyprenyl glycosylphosphotransferase